MSMAGLKNSEGYPDPTAEKAIKNVDNSRDDLSKCVHIIRAVASAYGYEITERIVLRDKKTRKYFR